MKPKRRKRLIIVAVFVALVAAAMVVVHLPSVQLSIWNRIAAAIEESSGWQITTDDLALRAVPAQLRASGVVVAYGGRNVISLDRLEADWRWLGILRPPHRLESLVVEGVDIDIDALPEGPADDQDSAISLWELVEIGELRILGFSGAESISGIEFVVDGLNIDAQLVSGLVAARLTAEQLSLARVGRVLDLGSVDIEGHGSQEGLRVERLQLGSAVAAVSVTGEVGLSPTVDGSFEVGAELDLETVAGWWDPNLVTELEPVGRVELQGHVAMTEAEGLELELSHRGRPIRIAGYDIEVLDLAFSDGRPSVHVAHPGWGHATATMTAPGGADLYATLDGAPVDRVLAFAAPRIATVVGQPATLSGEIVGTVSYPILPEYLTGRVDLVMQSPLGRIAVRAEGAGNTWRVAELDARAVGATLRASGTIDEDGAITADALLAAAEPRLVAESVGQWLPAIRDLEVDGGPVEARVRVDGVLSAPRVSATMEWADPVIGGRSVERIAAEASGGLDDIEWRVDLSAGPRLSLVASGSAQPLQGVAEGVWEMRSEDLEELMVMLPAPSDIAIQGRLEANGQFAASGSKMRVEGEVSVPDLAAGEWSVENLRAVFTATPEEVVVTDFHAEAFAGTVEGGLTAALAGLSAPASADLRWRDIDLRSLPVEMPEPFAGLVSGRLRVDGSLARPEGVLEVVWLPAEATPLVGEVQLLAGLTGGLLTLVSERVETAGGPAWVEAVAPLGDLPLPEWLWSGAPGGPVRVNLEAPGFHSGPLVQWFGHEGVPADAEADLRAELVWDPRTPERPRVMVEANNLRIRHTSGDLIAEGPLVISVDGSRLELAPLVLVGLGSRIEASALYDPTTELVAGRVRAQLAPEVTGMLPIPLTVEGPITVNADFEVPVERSVSLMAVRGRLTIDHRDGRMVMREPPLEVRDLRVVASLQDGVIDILHGGAEVNRGRVDLGGGWDPKSGQGLVLELDDVTTMVAGILTMWDGNLVVEPQSGRLARVSGDLTLVAGLWDERFDLASAMLGGRSTATTGDDTLQDISLDVTVRGLAGVRVENNLGRFDVNWDQLHVGGTAGAPVLRGEVRIAPGGVLALAGQTVRVRRGVFEFTGNPDIDPLMEIVPESDTTLFGDENRVDTTELATRGLAQGITSALGFENETFRPAEIAIQTESDPSVRFMTGQRLSRQLALFLATNLTDVQDRMTMLQYWNIPRFQGLALQAYQETADENLGTNIFQRFEWGGSRIDTDRPEIHRLRLEGEWPLSKRSLRRATRLRRGQLFDGFLLFVGAVRMERMLAEHGYQNARVTGVQEGRATSPTLVFTCDPGDAQLVKFEGDSIPSPVRREVTALYRRPPRESGSFDNMVSLVRDHVVGEGFIAPDIAIERLGELIVIDVRKGDRFELQGPFFEGMPVDTVNPAVRVLATAEALALAVERPDWATGAVERILRSAGFYEAKVLDVWMEPIDSGKAEVHISVSPGERAVVESVDIVGNDPLGLTADENFVVRPGMPLDRSAIDSATREIRHAYVEEGYRDANVRSSIEHDEGGSWHVEILLDPGRRRTVREVRFTGRRDVSERVLLKGVTLAPGEVLTDRDLDRSASQIANFSPVKRAVVETLPVRDSQVDVEFDVVEKRRWTVEVGGGWSTERSFSAAFGARDDNLFGRGIGLNLRGSSDAVEKQIFLLGSIPPVPGGRLAFISTIGYSTGDAPDEPDLLNQDQFLGSFEVSYNLPRSVRVGVYYRWTDTTTYVKVPDDSSPPDINVQVGTLGARTVIERFDFLFDPRSGWGLTSDIGWSAGAIGSDLDDVSWLSAFSLAREPFQDATWMQSIRFGVAEPLKGTTLDRETRFFAGGQASVRGFDLNTVGPVKYGIEGSLVPAGGGALFILNEELRIPIWNALRLAVFADIGQVWESWREASFDLSVGVGLGVRWSTPIGPLWADVAWPVANIGISSREPKFYLGIGRPF